MANDTYNDDRDRKLCDRLGWPAPDVCEHAETVTHRRGGDIWDTCHECGEEVTRRPDEDQRDGMAGTRQ